MKALLVSVLVLAVVIIIGVVAYFAVSTGDERTSWQLAESPSGTELQIGVLRGACESVDDLEVQETDEAVVIKSYLSSGSGAHCTDMSLHFEPRTVQLDAPLGDRELSGCNPASSDTDCALGLR